MRSNSTFNFPVGSVTSTKKINDIDSVSESIPVIVIPVVVYGTLKETLSTITEIFSIDVVTGDVGIIFDSILSASVEDAAKL